MMLVGFISILLCFVVIYGGVGVLDVNVGVGDGLVCFVVYNLDGKCYFDIFFVVGDVFVDFFVFDVY